MFLYNLMDPITNQETVKTDEINTKIESEVDLKKEVNLRINTSENRNEGK